MGNRSKTMMHLKWIFIGYPGTSKPVHLPIQGDQAQQTGTWPGVAHSPTPLRPLTIVAVITPLSLSFSRDEENNIFYLKKEKKRLFFNFMVQLD